MAERRYRNVRHPEGENPQKTAYRNQGTEETAVQKNIQVFDYSGQAKGETLLETAKRREAEANVFECIAANGQKSTISLPDGTKVMLNSGSSIRYASDFNVKNRDIDLNGEAYFEVARNEEIPLVVSARQMKVEVLGTKFNVRAYNSEPEIVTTLVEGCVKATADGREMLMKPAEEISYNVKSGEMRKYDAPNKNHLIPWRDNELFFNNNNLKEIGAILERMYNVNVIFEDESVTAYSYTGLVRNSSLSNVLDLITATSPVEAQMYYNTIKFSRRRTGRK